MPRRWSFDALNRMTSVTYPDSTHHSYRYAAASNRTSIVDANGTQVAQTFDNANRLTSRAITRAAGVVGPTSGSFQYEGFNRTTQARCHSHSKVLCPEWFALCAFVVWLRAYGVSPFPLPSRLGASYEKKVA